jgi:hypothetical protein
MAAARVEVELVAPHAPPDVALVQELVRLVNEAYASGEAGLCLEGTTRTTTGEIVEAIRSRGMLAATLAGRLVGCAYVRPPIRPLARRLGHWAGRVIS